MDDIITTLMNRDGIDYAEAAQIRDELKKAIREALRNGEDPADVMQDMVGLEPDYLEEFIFSVED